MSNCSVSGLPQEKLPQPLVPSPAACASRRRSAVLDDAKVLKQNQLAPGQQQATKDVPGPTSMPEPLDAGGSLALTLGFPDPGDAGGIGGGAIVCEDARFKEDEACREPDGEAGTELRSGAITEGLP